MFNWFAHIFNSRQVGSYYYFLKNKYKPVSEASNFPDSVVDELVLEAVQRVSGETTQQLCSTPVLCSHCTFVLRFTSPCGVSTRLWTACGMALPLLNLPIASQHTQDSALRRLWKNKQR